MRRGGSGFWGVTWAKVNMTGEYPLTELKLPEKGLRLKDTVIVFDRDQGISTYQNFRGYNNLVDDAEWLLERTLQKSRGFIIRPIAREKKEGIWVGEYNHEGSQINRQDLIFGNAASALSKLILSYADRRISEKTFIEKIAIKSLKKKLKSRIVQDFKYFICPPELIYGSCVHVEGVYKELAGKYGKGSRIPHIVVAEKIAETKPCADVVVCPLIAPNSFEGVLNLDKALRSRKLGGVRLVTSDMVELT